MMKVSRNTTHGLRHDWLKLSAEGDAVQISLLAYRNEILVDVTIDGIRDEKYMTPRELAAILANSIHGRA